MEGRPAGEDDGGVPPEGASGEAAQVGLQVGKQGGALRHVRAREMQPWHGDDQRRAHGAGEQHKEGGQETEGRGG